MAVVGWRYTNRFLVTVLNLSQTKSSIARYASAAHVYQRDDVDTSRVNEVLERRSGMPVNISAGRSGL